MQLFTLISLLYILESRHCYIVTWEKSPYVVRQENMNHLRTNQDQRPVIWILGMFPMSGPFSGGQGMLPAAELALDHINSNPDVLPDYQLAMAWGDTQVARFT